MLARLDDALFKARVDQARASLAKAEADVEQARGQAPPGRARAGAGRKLHAKAAGIVAAQEIDAALADARGGQGRRSPSPRAAVAVAKANLEEATVNLGYTTIRSPVKGVILDRRVNIGQTVVASLNAPSLFLIAKDLSRMEIWASVNETDIGSIHAGPGGPVHRRRLPGRDVRGQGRADPPQRQHDPERRDLHRGRRRSTTPAASSCPT